MSDQVLFFETPEDFRHWLMANHDKVSEQWVGYYKKSTGRPSIDWPQSVDQALCFGWIDGVRRSIDEVSYKVRFTPRKPKSHWSRVNIDKVTALKKAGLMTKAGLDAFARMDPKNSEQASFEQKHVELTGDLKAVFRKNKTAWKNYEAMTPGYRKQSAWYVISAKQQATRLRRLDILIRHSELNDKIPPLRPGGK